MREIHRSSQKAGNGGHETGAGPPSNGTKNGHCNEGSSSSSTSSTGSQVELKKNLGPFSGTALIVGTMIGSGIFVSPRGVLEGTGSVGMSLIIWSACGLLALCGALTYAELGTAIPESGAEHAYFKYTFLPMGKCWGRIPVFLFDWLGVFVLRPSMFAIMSLTLGTYILQPFYPGCDPPTAAVKLFTIMTMVFVGFVNSISVKAAIKIQNILTVSKLVAAAIIIIGGISSILAGNEQYITEGFEGTASDVSSIAVSFYNGLWAYDGWNNLNFVTDELQDPARNLPLSIKIGIPLVTIVYVLVNMGYFAVMSKTEILNVDAVAVIWGEKLLGVMSWIMPVFVCLSCFGAVNGSIFSSGRLTYVAAQDNHLPKVLSFIHYRRNTPVPSIIFTVTVGVLLILPGDLSSLIQFFSFTAWIFYGLAAISTLVLRYREPNLKRPYKVFIGIPIFVLLASIYLVFAPIINNPQVEYLYSLMFVALGLLVFIVFVQYKRKPPCIDYVTNALQKALLILPSQK